MRSEEQQALAPGWLACVLTPREDRLIDSAKELGCDMGDRQPQRSLHRERWGLQKREGGASGRGERGAGTVLSRRPHCTLGKGPNSARGWKPCWLLVNLLVLLRSHSSVPPLPTPKLGQWDPLKAAVHRGPTHRSPGEPRGACCPRWYTALGVCLCLYLWGKT